MILVPCSVFLVTGRESVLKLLIELGANLDSPTNKLWPPIILAANKSEYKQIHNKQRISNL